MTTFEAPAEISLEQPVTAATDPISAGLADWLREMIWQGWATAGRSLQRDVGMSEVGTECERQLAYKIAGTAPFNLDDDPMPSLTGTGIHLVLADYFTKLHAGTGRWLIEHPVTYAREGASAIPGTVDAYDRRRKLVIDWKSTAKGKLRNIRAEGPPTRYVVQAQLYAAALRQAGEDPQRVALVYLPRDGKLSELTVWTTVPDPAFLDQWLDRLARIKNTVGLHDNPGEVSATPTRLCGWCDWHNPASTDTARACPGRNQ